MWRVAAIFWSFSGTTDPTEPNGTQRDPTRADIGAISQIWLRWAAVNHLAPPSTLHPPSPLQPDRKSQVGIMQLNLILLHFVKWMNGRGHGHLLQTATFDCVGYDATNKRRLLPLIIVVCLQAFDPLKCQYCTFDPTGSDGRRCHISRSNTNQ